MQRDIFPTTIAQKLLSPSDDDLALMCAYMLQYEQGRETSPKSNKEPKLFTGDTTGDAQIHTAPEFNWLTAQIENSAQDYVSALGYDLECLSMFHQKSWPVVTLCGGEVAEHDHQNAQVSAVFYLRCESDKGGELVFENPNPPIVTGRIDGAEARNKNKEYFGLKPLPHMLVIFPSSLRHKVLPYTGSTSRWSVSYDFTITTKSTLGAGRSENMLVHPSLWVEFASTRAS